MKAIIIKDDKSLRWEETANPICADGGVIIDIHAAGCNRADVLQRAGSYPPPPGWPDIMGLECSGIVAESKSDKYKVGDRVCALLGSGGYAERVAVDAGLVMPIPDNCDFVKAAAIPEVFATAYLNLVREAGIKAGDTVLIIAGASGLGSAAIQIAKMYGAKVITTVGSDDKIEFVKSLGADIAVNRKTGDLAAVLADNPPDIALDCAAGKDWGKYFALMNNGGRWIIIATLAGEESDINLRVVMKKALRLIGSTLRSRTNEVKTQILSELKDLIWDKLASGELTPIISKTVPMANAEEAHAFITGDHIGKVVLTKNE